MPTSRPSHLCGKMILIAMVLLATQHAVAKAKCNDARIVRLADSGKTIAAIARICEMEREDVKEALDKDGDLPNVEDGGGSEDKSSGLPKGTPIGQCGCWGMISLQHRQPAPQCQSGYAKPRLCPGQCPLGGSPWVGVCR